MGLPGKLGEAVRVQTLLPVTGHAVRNIKSHIIGLTGYCDVFQGEKGSVGPPGPTGYPGEPVRIKQFSS